jgi:hypothetical protein
MAAYCGWGNFPPVAARIHAITKDDVDQYEEFERLGWSSELAYSRPLSRSDIGKRIAHLENGHHRAYAAARHGIEIAVYDLSLQDHANEASCISKSSIGVHDDSPPDSAHDTLDNSLSCGM